MASDKSSDRGCLPGSPAHRGDGLYNYLMSTTELKRKIGRQAYETTRLIEVQLDLAVGAAVVLPKIARQVSRRCWNYENSRRYLAGRTWASRCETASQLPAGRCGESASDDVTAYHCSGTGTAEPDYR